MEEIMKIDRMSWGLVMVNLTSIENWSLIIIGQYDDGCLMFAPIRLVLSYFRYLPYSSTISLFLCICSSCASLDLGCFVYLCIKFVHVYSTDENKNKKKLDSVAIENALQLEGRTTLSLSFWVYVNTVDTLGTLWPTKEVITGSFGRNDFMTCTLSLHLSRVTISK